MIRFIVPILVFFISMSNVFCQIDFLNQPQEDFYLNKVSKIHQYSLSKKDLDKTIELDTNGNILTIIDYSRVLAKGRKRVLKHVAERSFFQYDSNGKLTDIIDTVYYLVSSNVSVNTTKYNYNPSGSIDKIEYYRNNSLEPNLTIRYISTNPLIRETVRKRDSIIVDHTFVQYEKEIYTKRFYGYSIEPKLKEDTTISHTGEKQVYNYSDWSDLERFEFDYQYNNYFDLDSKILKSEVDEQDRNGQRKRIYKYYYYKNGLLKKKTGYEKLLFEYEYRN